MGLLLFGLLVVGGTTLLAIVGLLLVRRKVGLAVLLPHNEVAGSMLQVIGTLYAVLLGLLVVQSMGDFENSRLVVENEANSLGSIFRLSEALPAPLQGDLQRACKAYASAVVRDEWQAMELHQFSHEADGALDRLWGLIVSYDPVNDRQKIIYGQLIDSANDLERNRHTRLVTSHAEVSPVLWVVLFAGGLSTIVFTYFFGFHSPKAQMLMTGLVALTLSLNVYLWVIYSNPFIGVLKVLPEAFELALEDFEDSHPQPARQPLSR